MKQSPSIHNNLQVSVLVPVLDELQGIETCLFEISKVLTDANLSHEIIFVDDGSTDGTDAALERLVAKNANVGVVSLNYNVGQQAAMFIGLEFCKGQAIITYDSDLQFHPDCLPPLATAILNGSDMASGVRKTRSDSLFSNKIPSEIGKRLINIALGIKQEDFGAVKAYSQNLVKKILARPEPFVVIPAMAFRCKPKHYVEIEVIHQQRQTGVSKWSIVKRAELYFDIFTMYSRRPFSWMTFSGIGLLFVAFTALLGILLYKLFVTPHFSGLIVFFAVFLLVSGTFLFSIGMLGEFVVRSLRGRRYSGTSVAETHGVCNEKIVSVISTLE